MALDLFVVNCSFIIFQEGTEETQNIFELISEGFRRGFSKEANIIIIYFATVVCAGLLTYVLFKYLGRLLEKRKFDDLILTAICDANGITDRTERKAIRLLFKKNKEDDKFLIFITRKTFEKYTHLITDDRLRDSLMSKLYSAAGTKDIKA